MKTEAEPVPGTLASLAVRGREAAADDLAPVRPSIEAALALQRILKLSLHLWQAERILVGNDFSSTMLPPRLRRIADTILTERVTYGLGAADEAEHLKREALTQVKSISRRVENGRRQTINLSIDDVGRAMVIADGVPDMKLTEELHRGEFGLLKAADLHGALHVIAEFQALQGAPFAQLGPAQAQATDDGPQPWYGHDR